MGIILTAAAALITLVGVSFLIDALRSAPEPPRQLSWAPAIPLQYTDVDGLKLRYVVTGEGPPLLLLHTLRTQLDMFQKVVPQLARSFRVYALDLPGHGYSDIPRADLSPELFVRAVAGFLDRLQLGGVTVVGESIGGAIGLLLAARHNPRVKQVIAINPYDYDRGRGLRRATPVANLIFATGGVPVLGSTVTRLRSAPVESLVFRGGVRRRDSFPPELLAELSRVGNRPGYMAGFQTLVRHWPDWEEARREYGAIDRPVLLLYGEHDWSRPPEREADRAAIPGARLQIVPDAGHFLALDAPDEVVKAVKEFAATPT
jgi:pimeloyl-ACP methyl ester carboxylesterase